MRETYNIDKCDNDACKKILVDEKLAVRHPYITITLDSRYWNYVEKAGKPMSLGTSNTGYMFCDEECLYTFIKAHFAKIKMAAIKT